MKNKIFGILAILLFAINLKAQEDKLLKKDGLLRGTAGIEPGILLSHGYISTYISGLLEYHLEERVSVRGDISLYFKQKNSNLTANHGLYFGAIYHFTDKAIIDPYFGIQPGIHLTAVSYYNGNGQLNGMVRSNLRLVPVASLIGGVNFYVSRFFNFYVSTRGIFGRFSGGGAPEVFPIHEWRLTFGLGFNIGLKK